MPPLPLLQALVPGRFAPVSEDSGGRIVATRELSLHPAGLYISGSDAPLDLQKTLPPLDLQDTLPPLDLTTSPPLDCSSTLDPVQALLCDRLQPEHATDHGE